MVFCVIFDVGDIRIVDMGCCVIVYGCLVFFRIKRRKVVLNFFGWGIVED